MTAVFPMRCTVIAVFPEFRQATLRTGDSRLFALTDQTPLRWSEVTVGQQVDCTVTIRPPRVLRAEIVPTAGPETVARTRRVQESDIRWSREIGYESARPGLDRGDEPAPSSDPWGWIPDRAARAMLICAGTVLASAFAALAFFINR